MLKISQIIRADKEYGASVATVKAELSAQRPLPVIINGLSGGLTDAYVTECAKDMAREGNLTLILASSEAERGRCFNLLSSAGIRTAEYKARDFVFHNISASHDQERERLSVLLGICRGELDAIVTTPSAASQYTMPREVLEASAVRISVGDVLPPRDVVASLTLGGYAVVDMVESAGQVSLRGDILDIWQNNSTAPVRIEFFGDDVDRIAYFDAESQRSGEGVSSVTVLPAYEVILDAQAEKRTLAEIDKLIKNAPDEIVKTKLEYERAAVTTSLPLDARDRYIGAIYKKAECLFDYLREDRCAAIVLGTNECREEIGRSAASFDERAKELVSSGLISESKARYTLDKAGYEEALTHLVPIHINSFAGVGNMRAAGLFGFRCRRVTAYGGNPSLLHEDVRGFIKMGYRTLILTETKQGAHSLASALSENGIFASVVDGGEEFDITEKPAGSVFIAVGDNLGFELLSLSVAVLSMQMPEGKKIMKERKQRRIIKRAGGAGERLMSYADLSVGDYVVHASYGIGLFEGIEAVNIDGVVRDYITIRYAGTDKLFVPCERLELIGKYIGEKDSDGKVKLSKMGGGEWGRAKAKAKSAAKNIAKDLIRLYAERQRLPGFAFPSDNDMEDEFAAEFQYEETDSQLIAIEEIKQDMMRPVPMNRLLCGDVGFGKTEVALRAAFKAIMGGKQVAILVPTTILALQHFTTATARMRSYPVTVEMISRFRTPREEEKILRRVARGEVDVLIGTHKLLSKKVEFRDLGLLIIDEEQRFGVAQKEKLKAMAKNVDVLTLSATPIPRTLNMAMNGISDMSILDEAPGERRPVQTYVLEHDDAVIIDACRKELARGGQVLYVFNRIDNIELVATKLMRAMPEARIATAHGAMDKDELEEIWCALVKCEIDILVCTTIIETGVDLPLANTLIIENADRMGLSQLHQIRGRVGRSERQAYAYFTFRQGKALSEIATKRLTAIKEFATFGAGFKVALRDLEIRGAGNLLGAEQHGYIESVGYDLYVKLLSEAVLEEKGEVPKSDYSATVDIKISAHIPEKYIKNGAQRIEMYKKISLIRDILDMQDIEDELTDRYGEPPREVDALLKISLIRALASRAEIKKVDDGAGVLSFRLEAPRLDIWSEVFALVPELSFKMGATEPTVVYRARGKKTVDMMNMAVKILSEYCKILEEEKNGK